MPGFLGYRGGRGSSRSRGTLGKFAKFRGPALRAGIYRFISALYRSLPDLYRFLLIPGLYGFPQSPALRAGNLPIYSSPLPIYSRPMRASSRPLPISSSRHLRVPSEPCTPCKNLPVSFMCLSVPSRPLRGIGVLCETARFSCIPILGCGLRLERIGNCFLSTGRIGVRGTYSERE